MKSPVTSLRGNEKTEDIAITPALNPADFDDDVDEHKDVDHIHARELAAGYVEGSDAEKKLLTKLDFRLVPCCWILSLLGYLDRSNIGNAKTGGMQDDFQFSSEQYSVIVLLFFVSYTIFEIPSNMVLTRVRPSLYLSGLAVIWGGVAACMAATQTWQQMAGLRLVLGAIEAGFAPGCAFYLSSWYQRYRNHELARRYACFYTATATAGALSGLLAGVITQHLEGVGGIRGWRWLFIIEGVVSSCAGLIVWFFMPDYPTNSKFLTEEESILACQRLAMDGIGVTQGAHVRIGKREAVIMTLADWRVWAQTILFNLVCGSQTMQYFLPTIVGVFGWKGYEGQYHTIPGYAMGIVCILGFCFLADYYRNKWIMIIIFAAIGTIFFVVATASTDNMTRYVTSLLAFGIIWGCSPLVKTWATQVIPYPAEKRAIAIALINSLGNASSIYGSWLWPDKDKPHYTTGFAVTTSWMGCLSLGAGITAYFVHKYPQHAADANDVVAAELRKQRIVREGKETVEP
ncbi:putative nicotinamide mononucleotide permease [Melanomma pulvis-pyrius CBS 109.77]|uniref:Putative nicotinamide mononucleotide permease n=1 Tax=Melanomma pulvis-pyrius CBS 109.77 TaxID=1314802 RepID=A0A6A6XM43_9PLEO|nr:putative nicotinamide mononucleotide permease [Melanomma pulvis-pyrius CBS 109.77]